MQNTVGTKLYTRSIERSINGEFPENITYDSLPDVNLREQCHIHNIRDKCHSHWDYMCYSIWNRPCMIRQLIRLNKLVQKPPKISKMMPHQDLGLLRRNKPHSNDNRRNSNCNNSEVGYSQNNPKQLHKMTTFQRTK